MAKKRTQRKAKGVCATAPAPIVNIAERRSVRRSIQANRKESILLAVPTVDGRGDLSIAMTFARAMASNSIAECPVKFECMVEPGTRPIEYARNKIVRHFMEDTNCDWLLMMDDDERIPDNFWELCTVADADVVAAVVPVWVANGNPAAFLRVNTYGIDAKGQCYNVEHDLSADKPMRAPAVGTGAIAIRRRVFAPKPYGLGVDSPFYFTREENGKIKAGEDINFSVAAQKAGFVVAVHPNVKYDHVKNIPLWQVETYCNARSELMASGKRLSEEERLSLG